MTKLSFALALLNKIRAEKDPPLIRYCTILALAESPGRSMTPKQIFRRFGHKQVMCGSLPCTARLGLMTESTKDGQTYYSLTPEGEALAKQLLSPEEQALPA
jgi:hypothetical protein